MSKAGGEEQTIKNREEVRTSLYYAFFFLLCFQSPMLSYGLKILMIFDSCKTERIYYYKLYYTILFCYLSYCCQSVAVLCL